MLFVALEFLGLDALLRVLGDGAGSTDRYVRWWIVAAVPIFLLWIYLSWLVTLLGATIAANLPVIRQGYWRRRTFAGSEFFDALGVLLLLYRARDEVPRSVGELRPGCECTARKLTCVRMPARPLPSGKT